VKTADCVVNNLRGTQAGQARHRLCQPEAPQAVDRLPAQSRPMAAPNERSDWPGYDFLMQAEAGLMELNRRARERPADPCRCLP